MSQGCIYREGGTYPAQLLRDHDNDRRRTCATNPGLREQLQETSRVATMADSILILVGVDNTLGTLSIVRLAAGCSFHKVSSLVLHMGMHVVEITACLKGGLPSVMKGIVGFGEFAFLQQPAWRLWRS